MKDHIVVLPDISRSEADEFICAIDELRMDIELKTITSKGFIGVGDITIVITALGGGAIVKALATILVAWMKQRQGRRVKLGKTEITGYSAEQVQKILEATQK